jgi:hypothetical protein
VGSRTVQAVSHIGIRATSFSILSDRDVVELGLCFVSVFC